MRAVWLLAAALASSAAAAAPCDTIQAPLAYNACLARQGPAAHAVRVGPAPGRADATPRTRGRRVGGRIFVTRPHGRSELVFSPGR